MGAHDSRRLVPGHSCSASTPFYVSVASAAMQTVHRQFGRFMKRSADDSQISVLLKEFEDADKLLSRVS